MSSYGSSSYGNSSYGYTAPSAAYGYVAAAVNPEPQDNALANPSSTHGVPSTCGSSLSATSPTHGTQLCLHPTTG